MESGKLNIIYNDDEEQIVVLDITKANSRIRPETHELEIIVSAKTKKMKLTISMSIPYFMYNLDKGGIK